MTCASCGFAAAPDFAFCPRCGAKLTASPEPPATAASPSRAHAEGDRRIASVLFADLSGFTSVSERLDPEDVRSLQTDLIHELSAAIEKYEGFVEKYVGDAVLAAFGAPRAHEDDPVRALHAALEMRQRVEVLSERWEQRLGATLALHIGVNTGPVVAGTVGSGVAAAYAVTGDTVNTAARLQSLAGGGEIVVSESTFRLTEHAFEFEELGAVTLKGRVEPVNVYRLLALLLSPRPGRGLDAIGLATPLIGREAELESLERAFERMRQGRTQLVSITGEAGAGKTHLQSEFLAHLKQQGKLADCAIRSTGCLSTGEQPYGVMAALLREAYQLSADDTLETARAKLASGFEPLGADADEAAHFARLLGHILGLALEDPLVQHVEPDQLKRQLYMAARAAIERRLEQGALLFIVEDLHWGDAASTSLLEYLLDHIGNQRLMLLVTHRGAPVFNGIETTNAEHTILRLDSLPFKDCEQLLSSYFGVSKAPLPERVRSAIIERSGGNPLFLEELVRALIERGVLALRDGEWVHQADAETTAVPLTLHGLLISHIDRLRPDLRAVLQEAAVIGAVIDDALLRALEDRVGLEAALAELVAAELLVTGTTEVEGRRRGRRTYRFRHALLQEAVYQNLLMRRRTELHTRVGIALERRFGEPPQRLEEIEALGHHWSLSEDRSRGARYLVEAGDWARSIFANEDALRHYRRALDTLTQCDAGGAMLPGVHERLGDVLGIVGEGASAISHYQAALGCFDRMENRSARARQLRKIAELLWAAGDRAAAKDQLEGALTLLEGSRDHLERAHLYQTLGRHAFRSGDSRGAVDWAETALTEGKLAAGLTTEEKTVRAAAEAISQAYNTLGVALAQLGNMREAVDHLECSVAMAYEKGLHQAACRGLANLAVLYSTLDPRRAIETCTRGLETAKKIGDFALQSRLYSNLAVAYCSLTNRCDEHGISAAHAAIDLDRRLGQIDHLTVPLIVLAQIQQCHGEPAAAYRYYQEALALAEQTGEAQLLFPCYDGLATLYLDAGDDAEAERYMIQAHAVCERAGVRPETLVVLPFLD
jgi:adenylate cyclase